MQPKPLSHNVNDGSDLCTVNKMLDDYLQIKINKSRTCYDNYKKYQHTKF